jgi:hypothetical protein
MDALQQQLIEALVIARLAFDRVDAGADNLAEISQAKEMAEAAIRATIQDSFDRALLSGGDDNAQKDAKSL